MYKRIQSDSIKLGESFILSGETQEDEVKNLTMQKKLLNDEVGILQAKIDELNDRLKDSLHQKEHMLSDAKKLVEDIKLKADIKANEIIQEASMKKEEIFQEARNEGVEEGFKKGYEDGIENFKQECIKRIESLNALTNAAFEVKNEIVFSSEKEIIELAMLIASKVVQVEFVNNAECFKNMTTTALSMLKEKEDIKIVVNPRLLEYASEFAEELKARITNLDRIKIIQDKTVSSDGVVVESLSSRIDARISSQIEKLSRVLLAAKNMDETVDEQVEKQIQSKLSKNKNKDKDV
ncbi:MAG: FliH/SctL family protein [Candidatus Gastranaerophilales bacterium]|nr:FliH/SctL family protein [Candidatus Gastranaerophilales bacterium]